MTVLFQSTWSDGVNSFTMFNENKRYREDTISMGKISKGHNSAKSVGGVTVLFSLHIV